MNKSTNPLKLFCAVLAGLMMSVSAFAQTKPVTITVFDETGPLPGASIMVKGTTTGTVTDLDGNAVLDLEQGDVLEVSFIGYNTAEATVGSGDRLQVVLKEDTTCPEEGDPDRSRVSDQNRRHHQHQVTRRTAFAAG